MLREFILGGEGFRGGFREVLRFDGGEGEGLHRLCALLVRGLG